MNNIKDLSISLEKTIKDSDLQCVTVDIAEALTDSLLNDGLLRGIPIIGTIVGLTKVSFSISESLFIKKILYFLTEIKDVDAEERTKLISDIDRSEKQKIRVGEKLLYILEKCDDHTSASYVAIVFSAFLKKEISYSDFLRCSSIIQKLFNDDFEHFIKTENSEIFKLGKYDSLSDFQIGLVASGVCATEIERFTVDDNDDYKSGDKYKVGGGSTNLYLSDIGAILKNIFKKIAANI